MEGSSYFSISGDSGLYVRLLGNTHIPHDAKVFDSDVVSVFIAISFFVGHV